jgi:NADH dehydrogenase [ubiquinone] 1 alpha subcomplex assembly factor 1
MGKQNSVLITDFSNLAIQKWKIVNDDVMGGVSSSQFQINEAGNAVFTGRVSLENNGGFASVKNIERLNLENYHSVLLKVKGDGKRYSFRFRTGSDNNVHNWVYHSRFETKKDRWVTLELAFDRFLPKHRGRILEDVPAPDLSGIKEYGFLISDKQEGDFRLEIECVKAMG